MAFQTNSSSGVSPEINVTPLIDVLLVLLIIFMVLVPIMPRGLPALLPQPSRDAMASRSEEPIVVQVQSQPDGGAVYRVNQQSFSKAALAQDLAGLLDRRQQKVLFVRGDRNLDFSSVAEVVALGHQANADRIGILTSEDAAR